MSLTITIIIPTLNEARSLPRTLMQLQSMTQTEIIIVDGGSQDETIAIAKAAGVTVIRAQPGRAQQMNAGAAIATSEVLLFLHADTQLPEHFDRAIDEVSKTGAIAGAFQLKINGSDRRLRWIEWGVQVRSRMFQLPYGDQAIFLNRDTFEAIGGFPDLPIMEDFELMRRLKRLGTIAIAPAAVITSDRRWQTLGIARTTLINQVVIAAYCLGVSPDRIRHWYRSGFSQRHRTNADSPMQKP